MKAGRRILWVALAVTVPLPFFMVDVGCVPAVRLLLLAGLCAAAAVTEPGWDTGYVSGLLGAQAALALAVLYVAARCVAGVLWRRAPARWRAPVLAAIVAALFAVALLPIYHTPLASTRQPTNLSGVLR